MEVILREDVPHLGSIGDIVKVRAGYARNYLLPRGLAALADARNIRALEHERRLINAKYRRVVNAAEALAGQLSGMRVVIAARVGEEGRLFGSVTNLDVERALRDAGFVVERKRIHIEEPIKSLGDYVVSVSLAAGITTTLTVAVVPLIDE